MTRFIWLAAAVLGAACGPLDTSGSGAAGASDAGAAAPADAGPAAAGGGSSASIRIVSPEDGEDCKIGGKGKGNDDRQCTVRVAVSGAVLAAPGQCGGSSGSCGHIDFFIDGASCGSPNVQTSATTFDAQPQKCPSPSGRHAFSCELRDDRGNLLATSQAINVRIEVED